MFLGSACCDSCVPFLSVRSSLNINWLIVSPQCPKTLFLLKPDNLMFAAKMQSGTKKEAGKK